MAENNSGPAFPRYGDISSNNGMTLHQWYAGMALQGIRHNGILKDSATIAVWAIRDADAMLKAYEERDK